MTTVSFPGIGIDPITMNKVAFTLFGKLEVRWYGIILTLGIVLAFLYAVWRGKRSENVTFDDVIDIGLWTVTLGVIGARAYYVLTTLDTVSYDSFLDVIAIWNGGIAIYGSIIGGCLGIYIACRIKKIKWQKTFDMIGPGVALAQALGRWGNFVNGEAYGYRIADTTKFYFFNKEFTLNSGEGTLFHTLRMGLQNGNVTNYWHPTFLYECVWNLLGFVVLNLAYKRKKFDGQIALAYFTWYGFGRMFIEGLRTDSLYITGTDLRISQCLGFASFLIAGAALLILSLRKRPPEFFRLAEETAGEEKQAECAEPAIVEAEVSEDEKENTRRVAEKDEADRVFATRLLERFAAKIERVLNRNKSDAEPAEEPVPESVKDVVAEPAEEPVPEPVEDVVAEPAEEAVPERAAEPVGESAENEVTETQKTGEKNNGIAD